MTEFSGLLREMSRLPGVRAAMVGSIEAGVVVDAELMIGVDGDPVAALAASLLKRTCRSLGAGDLGTLEFVQVEAGEGYLFAATPGAESDLFLAVVADRGVSPGMIRVEMRRGTGALS